MKIKTIESQSRRDFNAIYQCEHCGHEKKGSGYDDANFHNNVIPKMKCENCGKIKKGVSKMKITLRDYKKELEDMLKDALKYGSGYRQAGISKTINMVEEDIKELGLNHIIEI